jgi:hypothetical protein
MQLKHHALSGENIWAKRRGKWQGLHDRQDKIIISGLILFIPANVSLFFFTLFLTSYITIPEAMLGLSGFTTSSCFNGLINKSMSSKGMAPSRTRSPRTKAPVKQLRF